MSSLKKINNILPSTSPSGQFDVLSGGLFIILFLLFSCKNESNSSLHFTFLPSSETNITFNNQITESDSVNFYNNEYMYIGSGVGVGDFNNDGLQDVFFGGSQVASKLYLNKGNSQSSSFKFEDITEKAGIKSTQWVTGVSVIDINQDGWQDIYLCVSHFKDPNLRKNKLFINQGISPSKQERGLGGEVSFLEQAEKYGLADTGFSSQANFFDYDKDGDLDMYLLNHKLFEPQPNRLVPIDTTGNAISADKLYRNNSSPTGGGGGFEDVSKESGILEDGYGLGIVVSDFNNDNYPDIYIANDYLSNDYFWQNDGKGHFKNVVKTATKHQSFSSMGVDAADINNDLLPDLAVLDMMPNTTERKKMMVLGFTPEKFEMQRNLGYEQQFSRNMLQLNRGLRKNGEPIFSEIGHLAGIAETDWSWSVLMADFDNDTWRDIHISNGLAKDLTNNDFIAFTQETQENQYSFGGTNTTISPEKIKQWVKRLGEFEPVKKTNFFFKNNKSLQFSDETQQVGITESSVSQGAAYADFDNDGDLDLVVNNMNQEAFVMRNDLRKSVIDSTNNFLKIQLNGKIGNLSGIGTKVLIYSNNQAQIIEQSPIRGYASTVDNRLHFGLGNSKKIDSLKVIWSSGKTQKLLKIRANQILVLNEKEAIPPLFVSPHTTLSPKPLFVSPQTSQTINFKHQETPFFDYYQRRLQPQKYSQLGPCMAKGDVNGDGLEDIFIGGAAGQASKILIQTKNAFSEKNLENKPDDDLAAEFFDADGDKDLDLIITGGSTEYQHGYTSQPRLYLNDGKGNFSKNELAFTKNLDIFSSAIAINDFDNDGDLDLFIGGRIDKTNFPKSPKSYLFENRKGIFIDVTGSFSADLQNAGMITDALWMDVDNDKIEDLVIAGEWMSIRFFKNNRKKLTEITDKIPLKNNSGMWRSLAKADLDGDGDLDLVAGNYGKNNKYHATAERPFYLFAKDLDQNGSIELLPAYFIQNNDKKFELYPDFDRHQIADQTPIIKKKYLLHTDFAKTTMDQLLDDLGRTDLQQFTCETTASVWLENLGNGQFKGHELPIEAQFAPINAILINDFDGDKKQDILIAGNEYQTEVSTGRNDASIGLFLKGNGKGNFKSISFQQSRFIVEGDVKSMLLLGNQVFVGINNEKIRMFMFRFDNFQKVGESN
jgi:enediyne biosynthesis protein E4